MNRNLRTASPQSNQHCWFAVVLGAFLGLCLVKFGNPVILDHHVHPPGNILELLFGSWPIRWAYVLGAIVIVLSPLVIITGDQGRRSNDQQPPKPELVGSGRSCPRNYNLLRTNILYSNQWVRILMCCIPLLWYAWQWIGAFNTVDPSLTRLTMMHFTLCVGLFYVGWFCLPSAGIPKPVFIGMLCGFGIMLWTGFDQHFGGLAATREMVYTDPNWQQYPPDFLSRIASDRIFGTMFYPNALAGAILLLFPGLFWFLNRILARKSNILRGTIVGLFCYASAACLYWSQSKAGWLVAATLVFISLLQLPAKPKVRWTIASLLVLAALITFSIRFADYFERGATSAAARMDYWEAAWTTVKQNPITGTGPGTFQIPYATLKRPESEMSRLTHNDYLQQGSDTGLPALVIYTLLMVGSLVILYPVAKSRSHTFVIWLGLTGFAMHSFVEFGLYIPAIAWPAFTLLGWLWSTSATANLRNAATMNPLDSPTTPA